MKKLVHNLRSQPHEIKMYILYALTFSAAIILFILWVYSFGGSPVEPTLSEAVESDLEPFGVLKANLVDGYNSFSN